MWKAASSISTALTVCLCVILCVFRARQGSGQGPGGVNTVWVKIWKSFADPFFFFASETGVGFGSVIVPVHQPDNSSAKTTLVRMERCVHVPDVQNRRLFLECASSFFFYAGVLTHVSKGCDAHFREVQHSLVWTEKKTEQKQRDSRQLAMWV